MEHPASSATVVSEMGLLPQWASAWTGGSSSTSGAPDNTPCSPTDWRGARASSAALDAPNTLSTASMDGRGGRASSSALDAQIRCPSPSMATASAPENPSFEVVGAPGNPSPFSPDQRVKGPPSEATKFLTMKRPTSIGQRL